MKALKEETAVSKMAEGIARGHGAITMDVRDAQLVLDRVKSLEHALVGLIRSSYERSLADASKTKAAS